MIGAIIFTVTDTHTVWYAAGTSKLLAARVRMHQKYLEQVGLVKWQIINLLHHIHSVRYILAPCTVLLDCCFCMYRDVGTFTFFYSMCGTSLACMWLALGHYTLPCVRQMHSPISGQKIAA